MNFSKDLWYVERLNEVEENLLKMRDIIEKAMDKEDFGLLNAGKGSSKSPVYNVLNRFANYLLGARDVVESRSDYTIFTDRKMFEARLLETSINDVNMDIFVEKTNYKNQKRVDLEYILKNARKQGGVEGRKAGVLEYQVAIDALRRRLGDMDYVKASAARRMLKEWKKDQLELYEITSKTIVAKKLGDESTEYYLDNVYMGHVGVIRGLLDVLYKKSSNLSGDLQCILCDFLGLLSRTELTERQKEIVELFGNDMKQEDMGERLGIGQDVVSRHIDNICEAISDQHKKELLDRRYIEFVRGEYKTCKKCMVVKLVSEFNKKKDNKDGLKNYCKDCD